MASSAPAAAPVASSSGPMANSSFQASQIQTPTGGDFNSKGPTVSQNYSSPAQASVAATNNSATSPTLIVTSGQSRSNYANNVSTMNSANTNATASSATIASNNANNPITPSTTTTAPANSGRSTGTTIAPDGTITVGGSSPTTDGSSSTTGGTPTNPANGNTTGTTVYNSDGTPNTTGQLDPAISSALNDQIEAADQEVQSAQATLTTTAATLANDPAAAQAIGIIQSQFAQLYSLQSAKNDQLMGRANSAVGAFGGLGSMSTSYLSDEMSNGINSLNTILTNENNAMIKSNQAYQSGDLKAFDDATAALKDAQTAKTTAIMDLANATSKALTDFQNQQKIDAAAQKQALTTDVTTSTNMAASVAQQISDSGITDPAQIKSYIDAVASENGISNPSILESAVAKAQATNTKADVDNTHTQAETDSTNAKTALTTAGKGGKDGGYTYTGADVSTYANLMDQGGTVNGTTYNARGSDGYVDPGAFTAVYNDWISNGGTTNGFLKAFPVKGNVNPAGYTELPSALQPVTTSTNAYSA